MTLILWLRRYWKPLAVLLLLLAVWLHGHNTGAENMDTKWQAIFSKQQLQAANARVKASESARKQEQDWSAAFDLTTTMLYEDKAHVAAHRDRLLSGLRTGRLRIPAACPRLPEAAADTGQPETAEAGGQSGLAGDALVARLAVCDEVVLERNQAVELLMAERE